MTDQQALDILCRCGHLPVAALNALHSCRENHPLNNAYQWRNAALGLAGRGPWFTDERGAVRHVLERATAEAAAQAAA